MKIFPTARYTFAGTFPDTFRPSGHCTPDELDANLHRHKTLTGSLPAFGILAAWPWDDFRFPIDLMDLMDQRGVVPWVIIWPYGDNCLDRINSGELDGMFRESARQLYDWHYGRRPVMAQFGTEVTFEAYPWSAAQNGGWEMTGSVDGQRWPVGPAKYVHAARRVWHLYADAYCDLTWNFHVLAEFRENQLNRPRWYYPGPQYADWVGAGIYRDREGGLWGTYEGGLRESLAQLDEIPGAADKPLYVEIMCQEKAGDPSFKADFFRDCFARTFGGEFPRAARNGGAIGVWDAYTATTAGTEVFSGGTIPPPKCSHGSVALASAVPLHLGIDSSPASLAAFREGVQGAWYANRARLM